MNFNSLLIEKNGTGIEKGGTGIEKGGTGIEKGGTGIEKGGTGIEKGGTGIRRRALPFLASAVMAFGALSSAPAFSEVKFDAALIQDDQLVTISLSNCGDFKLLGSAALKNGYAVANLYQRIGGSGTGQKIGGSGTGQKIGGSGTGQKIGGSGTGQKIGGSGTGQRATFWGNAEIAIEKNVAFVILYRPDERGQLSEAAVFELPVLGQ